MDDKQSIGSTSPRGPQAPSCDETEKRLPTSSVCTYSQNPNVEIDSTTPLESPNASRSANVSTTQESISRPGAVYETASSTAATKIQAKMKLSAPQMLQGLDDAIQTKLTQNSGVGVAATSMDDVKPMVGAFAESFDSKTRHKVDSSGERDVLSQMQQSLDNRIRDKMARSTTTVDGTARPGASAQHNTMDNRIRDKIARSTSASSSASRDGSINGTTHQHALDDRIRDKVARSSSSSSSASRVGATPYRNGPDMDHRIRDKVARSASSSSSDSRVGAMTHHNGVDLDDRIRNKVARTASSSSTDSNDQSLSDRIRDKLARSTHSTSSVATGGSNDARYGETLDTLDERIRAKANNVPRTFSSSSTASRDSAVSDATTLTCGSTMEATQTAPQSHTLSAMARFLAASSNLDERIRAKVNRTLSSSSADSRDSTISMLSTGSSKCAGAAIAAAQTDQPPASLQALECRIRAKVNGSLPLSSHAPTDQPPASLQALECRVRAKVNGSTMPLSSIETQEETPECAAHAELQDLDRRIRAKVGRSLSSSSFHSCDSGHSAATSRSAASSIALDSLDARIDEKRSAREGPSRRLGRPGRRREPPGQSNDKVEVTTSQMPDHSERSARRQNIIRKRGDEAVNTDVSEAVNRGGSNLIKDTEKSESHLLADATENGGDSNLLMENSIRRLERTLLDIDLEYGDHANLAVAIAVEDEEDMYLPSAIEFDPDAKPPMYRNRRFHLYLCLAMELVVLGVVGAFVGTKWASGGQTVAPLPDRDTLGIREYAQRLVGLEAISDPKNPYHKALQWIQYVDPTALGPDNEKFAQRFLAAYFYYETSVDKPWEDGCSEAMPDQMHERDNDCLHITKNVIESFEQFETAAKRWLSGADECHWAGVTCDGHGQIEKLDFSGSNMTGTFPEGIASFPFLHFLSLSHSELRGSLPENIGDLKHLNNFEVANNRFAGAIPNSFYGFRALYKANLGENNITGSISTSIGVMRDIKRLYAYQNQLTGSIPTEVGRMQNVAYLSINGNALSGTIPTQLGNLKHVSGLSLHRNLLNGTLPTELGMATKLTDLRLHENRLTGRVPMELSNIPLLDFLELNDNLLTGNLLPFVNMTAMIELHIQRNMFTGSIPSELGALKDMEEFAASGNNLTGNVPRKVCNLVKPINTPGTPKVLYQLELDCTGDALDGGVAEIDCPCCTHCCDRDGGNCRQNI